ncbi:MAG: ABC transporter ATP-binding protein [Flavobacteriia bacterium]|nr:ABC transporter ATP-binding protein [Flavobacteriia bacterium]OIP48513.1 MAG: antibiotic ABC transporter ATP-binding protein [Flavobacteriaceae bacterium CG2_30_31_66]PIV97332.1 MAG: antibiotic ABC transporter ATP-binding protein [Flavobacteriaceae bacterium CG17_big_fil_post_rev_8_21_14_2_50_31_13]PIX13494.1 MAG: antibiotic ABC transporter ATP-binding protein [Flavobacteriaceae bacterium CG_4_8_14_3_um_filter_31_8]PIY15017.1 MAG: antibiotic ABC transporter ATP-binding protein [Flavobacteria
MSQNSGKAFDMQIFSRLMGFAKRYRLYFFIASSSTILLAIFSVLSPYILINTVDKYMISKDKVGLLNYTLLMLGILLAEVFLQFIFIYFANWVGQHIIRDIRAKIFRHILQFKMSYFDTNSVGRLVTRVVSDIETIAAFFSNGVFTILSDILKMVAVTIIMLILNWRLALITLSILPILVYATALFQVAIKATFQEVRNQVANLNSFVQERVTGMKIVQLFNREQIEYQNFKEINDKHKKANIKTIWYYSVFFPIAEILSSIGIGLIVWFGGGEAIQNSGISVGMIMGFIQFAQMLFRPLRQIADKFNQLQMGIVAGERVFKVIDTHNSDEVNGTIKAENLQGDIIFDNVRFSYVKGEEVLKGISLDVKSGQTIAIVGATGAGKSTIINLINRFYEIDSGTIFVDGVSVEDYTLESLRNQIAIVLQDVFLFSDSILNNITLKDKYISLEDVENAAKQIGIHEFITTLPGGYHYNVKERGAMLSSGQRQLIAFLRAYVSKPSILILDEATSSVDANSEQMIQFATEKITKGRTSIVIAHRLATIKQADKILVMDKGLIVEEGTHYELLEKENGYYKNLYDKQFSVEQIS